MTHVRGSDAHIKYLLPEDIRPQLVSRHSSSLPISHRTEAKKKALSRRSRSASPCVKKTNNSSLTVSGNFAGSPQQRYPAIKATLSGTQVPVIRKSSHVSVKNPKPLRVIASAGAKPKQRSQILGEPQKFYSSPSVWEQISSGQAEQLTPYPPSTPADVNSNFSLANRNVTSHWRKVKHSHSPVSPLHELLLDENVVADIVSDECADVKKRKPDTTQCSLIATKSLFDAKLPPELKLKIFSYLNQREKGQCMFVSTEWNSIIRSPELWQHVNFREFRLCYGHGDTSGSAQVYDGPDTAMDTSSYSQCTQQCYGSYINRIENYISFLIDIQPKVKRLEFSFDLIEDNWMATVDRLFHLNMSELRYADINWRDTPTKPSYLSSPNQNLNDVKYKTRRRCRKFLNFLEEFVEEAPNLQSLVIPFEWSSRSMKALLSLKRLKNLALEKYFVFQRPVQEVFNSLGQMPCLERLVLEIWTPSSADMSKYSIISPSLRYLDLSQCRGFYLQSVDLPLLEVFIDERKPWNGPLTFPSQINLPCIGNILREGAPKLLRINTSVITSMESEAVEAILKTICPCRHHKSSITM